MFELMELPFSQNALEPYVSARTVEVHYGKHHKGYVDKLNELVSGTDLQNLALEKVIERTYDRPEQQAIYNNAGQVYNHNVYWNSVGVWDKLDAGIKKKVLEFFLTPDALAEKLIEEALKVFGSGWVWLAEDGSGEIEVMTTKNGDTPLVLGYNPLINIDVWEHAYYLDYQNLRKDYAKAFVRHLLKIA